MAGLSRFPETEVEKLLKRLVTLIVRYQVIGRGRTGRLEIEAAAIAKGIWDKTLKSAGAVWSQMLELVPRDDEFEEDFSRHEESKAQTARWLLRELEIQAWLDANPDKAIQHAPVSDPSKVNLEHVLPKNAGSDWAPILKADQQIA